MLLCIFCICTRTLENQCAQWCFVITTKLQVVIALMCTTTHFHVFHETFCLSSAPFTVKLLLCFAYRRLLEADTKSLKSISSEGGRSTSRRSSEGSVSPTSVSVHSTMSDVNGGTDSKLQIMHLCESLFFVAKYFAFILWQKLTFMRRFGWIMRRDCIFSCIYIPLVTCLYSILTGIYYILI